MRSFLDSKQDSNINLPDRITKHALVLMLFELHSEVLNGNFRLGKDESTMYTFSSKPFNDVIIKQMAIENLLTSSEICNEDVAMSICTHIAAYASIRKALLGNRDANEYDLVAELIIVPDNFPNDKLSKLKMLIKSDSDMLEKLTAILNTEHGKLVDARNKNRPE